ncbi:MAG: hydrogenase maturation factor, partial [Lachnospiraceae bacterium]|nr:hydrogenase maturation factor [Lachnospiraceae bacterium]
GAACSGAQPVMATLALLLPLFIKEEDLKSHMAEADAVAAELHIQIAGGHTEVSRQAMRPCVTVTVAGKVDSPILPGGARPGQDVVLSKWIGLEGTVRLAARLRDELEERYPLSMIEKAIDFRQYLSIIPEAATAAKSNVSAMHDVSGGGIFAALWELAESAGVGLSVDLKKIPIKQETIEICEFFGLNPYELSSGGSLLMTADNGESLVQALEAAQIPAVVIGKITEGNDRVVINDEEKRFLERPKADEINNKM